MVPETQYQKNSLVIHYLKKRWFFESFPEAINIILHLVNMLVFWK